MKEITRKIFAEELLKLYDNISTNPDKNCDMIENLLLDYGIAINVSNGKTHLDYVEGVEDEA